MIIYIIDSTSLSNLVKKKKLICNLYSARGKKKKEKDGRTERVDCDSP